MTPKKRRSSKSQLAFVTSRELVRWMHEEYLSEIVVDDLDPAPSGTTPSEVRFTWWLYGVGGKRVPYRVRAIGVRTWSLEGTVGDRAASVLPPDNSPCVHLLMEIPGRLELLCDRVEIVRGRAERVVERRAFTEYTYYRASGARGVSVADVLAALGAPPGATVPNVSESLAAMVEPPRIGPMDVVVAQQIWVKVFWMMGPGATGFDVSVSRGSASDGEWHRAQELPVRLGPSTVASAWEFAGSERAWARAVGLARR